MEELGYSVDDIINADLEKFCKICNKSDAELFAQGYRKEKHDDYVRVCRYALALGLCYVYYKFLPDIGDDKRVNTFYKSIFVRKNRFAYYQKWADQFIRGLDDENRKKQAIEIWKKRKQRIIANMFYYFDVESEYYS